MMVKKTQGSYEIDSFTPFSNHLDSTVRIFVLSNMMEWLGLSLCVCVFGDLESGGTLVSYVS